MLHIFSPFWSNASKSFAHIFVYSLNPYRRGAICVLEEVALGAQIVCTVAGRGVAADLVFRWHGQRRPRQRPRRQRRWPVGGEPRNMPFAGVDFVRSVTEMVLVNESGGECTEPVVIGGALADPDCAGVILVCGFVGCGCCGVIEATRCLCSQDSPSSPKKLCRF